MIPHKRGGPAAAGILGRMLPLPQLLADDRVLLRPFELGDIQPLLRIVADPEIRRRNRVPEPQPAAVETWIRADWQRREQETGMSWAVMEVADGILAGRCGLSLQPDGVALTSLWIAAELRGRGLAAQALRLASAWALEQWGVRRVQAACDPDNPASRRALLAAGMHPGGVLRGGRIDDQGRPVDQWVFWLEA